MFWGPRVWNAIHILAATMRVENALAYKRFLELLTHLLPDEQSRENLRDTLKRYPVDPYLRNNHDAFAYTFALHDLINKKLRKNIFTIEQY